MSTNFENPFAGYGSIIHGEKFIGRAISLQTVENRIFRPREPGNLAIIGQPKIGKSSLAYHSIISRQDRLIGKKVLPLWLNLAMYNETLYFFRSMVNICYEKLEELGWLSESIQNMASRALEDKLSWGEGYRRIQHFFKAVLESGVRVLVILDEFDHARRLFKDDISGFQGLRELSYRPEWRVAFVTTSRRTIRDIELQTQAISTLDGIFHKHYLAMFNEVDLKEYFERLDLIGVPITEPVKKRIEFYCGGYPYLLGMIGYELIEIFREKQKADVDQAAKRIEHSILDQYDRIVNLLQEDNTLGKLLQILFGPIIDVKQVDVEELLRYGLIKLTDQGEYVAFSTHFQTYLKLIERQIELWPIWRETEIELRNIITTVMSEKYGEHWIDKLEKEYPNLRLIFEKCRETQQKEEKSFGGRASHNLIDFTYPQDLFEIIFAEWNVFKAIFGRDKAYWGQRAQHLAKVRNPLAHNRDKTLYDYARQITEGYCKEILTTLRKGSNLNLGINSPNVSLSS